MKREFLQSFKVGDQPLPKEVIDAIMERNGQDIQAAKQANDGWEEKYNQAVAEHARQMQQLRLQTGLETAVQKAGGRNVKAIAALLDLETIGESQDIPAALDAALEELKAENGYLFEATTPPPYARGTNESAHTARPVTLAGALRERMGK